MKVNIWIFFILYLILFITLTIFDPTWGRNGLSFAWKSEMFNYYLKHSVNLIPFATIIEYLKAFNSLLSPGTVIANLLGNFICLMPLGFFLPILFKSQNNGKKFFLTTTLFVLGIELVQFITLSGRFDIDDIILNVSGAVVMFLMIKNKEINKLVRNIFLLKNNKIDMKILTKIFIMFGIVFTIILFVIIMYRKAYDDNIETYLNRYNYGIEIVDETEVCAEALEQFYEDELYIYYFPCMKSNNVYAIFNGNINEKYLVKDLLNNNPSNYDIGIENFERAGLKYIRDDKYVHIDFSTKGASGVRVNLEDNSILTYLIGNYIYEGDTFSSSIHIVPKKNGTEKVEIVIYDNENDIIETKKYLVMVDEELNVTHEELK